VAWESQLQPLEEMRRGSAVAEALIQAVGAGAMECARGLDAGARDVPGGLLGRFHKPVADPATAVCLVHDKGCDATPGAIVMHHWHEEVRRGPDQRAAILSDEHVGTGISEHVREPPAERSRRLWVAQLVEEAGELVGIFEPNRSHSHGAHGVVGAAVPPPVPPEVEGGVCGCCCCCCGGVVLC